MKVIIAGSRDVIDAKIVYKAIESSGFDITEVISGMAAGPDMIGYKWAIENNILVKRMPALWMVNGVLNRNAGFERNHEMGDYAQSLIAVWDGKSNGTKDMIKYMRKLNKPCFVYLSNSIDMFDY